MSWSFSNDKPIFQQIVDIIILDIISGKYALGERLPAVRDLAVVAGVNPNTMQRAFAEIESRGIIYTKRGDGRFVTEESGKIAELKNAYAKENTFGFINSLRSLNLSDEEIIKAVQSALNGGN